MAKHQAPRIRETLYEDASGVVYRAKDAAGHKVHLRKPKAKEPMSSTEQVAYQVAVERLGGIRHRSLYPLVSGGIDAADHISYVAVKPTSGDHLADKLRSGALSIEMTTALLIQALEVSELLSHFLADDGIWIETTARSILVSEQSQEPHFLFWPAPVKSMQAGARKQSVHDLVELTESALGWTEREVDEREGGHLLLWLKWLKESGADVAVREAHEMLAAAAGIEPPQSIEKLVEASRRKPSRFDKLPDLQVLLKSPKPSMPLFALLCFMLVIQAIIGWIIVRTINDSIDEELELLNSTYTSTPYTADRDSNRDRGAGSQPLDFD